MLPLLQLIEELQRLCPPDDVNGDTEVALGVNGDVFDVGGMFSEAGIVVIVAGRKFEDKDVRDKLDKAAAQEPAAQ